MYDVSGNYLTYSTQTSRVVHLRGSLTKNGAVSTLVESDFVASSTTLTSKAVSGTKFSLGGVFVDSLSVTIGKRDGLQLTSLTNSELFIEYGIELGNPNLIEWIPLGYYDVPFSGVKAFSTTVQLTANSRMARLDKSLGESVTSGTPYDFLLWVSSACNVPIGITSEEVSLFPNGTEIVSLPAESGCETYRDVLMWVCSLMACFSTINRDGELVVKRFVGTSVYTVNRDTIASSSYGDGSINIENIEMTIDDTFYSVVEGVSDDKTLTLDTNPLMIPTNIDSVRIARLTAIKNEVASLVYKPFKITFNGDPCIEVGDHITIGDLEDDFLVTSISLKFRGKSVLEGVSYSNDSTKQQSTKRGSSTSSGGSGSTNKNMTVRFENANIIEVNDAPNRVLFLAYELVANSVPNLCFLAVMNVSSAGTFSLTLTYNGVDMTLIPEEYMSEGMHMFSFALNLPSRDVDMTHILRGNMRSLDGGVASIAVGAINGSVSAWGLSGGGSGEWDGRLEIQEEFERVNIAWGTSLSLA